MTREGDEAPTSDVPAWIARVRRLTAQRGWTDRELARRAGMSPGWASLTIRMAERGTQPRYDTLVKMAQVFGEPVNMWLKLGGLAAPDGDDATRRPSFAMFVDGETALTSDQKRILKDLYASWVPASSPERTEPQHVRRRRREAN